MSIQTPLLYDSINLQSLEAIRIKVDENIITGNLTVSDTVTAKSITDNFATMTDGFLHNLNNPINDDQAATKAYVLANVVNPGNPNRSVQLNVAGAFAGSANLQWTTSDILLVNGTTATKNIFTDSLKIQDPLGLGIITLTGSVNPYTLTLPDSAGLASQRLINTGSANLDWVYLPSGSAGYIQFITNGYFDSSANLTWTGTLNVNVPIYLTNDLDSTTINTEKIYLKSGVYSLLINTQALTTLYTLTFPLTIGTMNQALITDGSGNLSWASASLPGSPNDSVQYNSSGNFAGSNNLIYNDNGLTLNGYLSQSVSTAKNPVYINNLSISSPTDVFIFNKYAYVISASTNSLYIADISTTTPILLSTLTDGVNLNNPSSVYISGSLAYISSSTGNSLTIVDISDSANPSVSGILIDATYLTSATSVYISGAYAYITSTSYFSIVDISDSTNPYLTGFLAFSLGFDVVINGIYAYVISSTNDSISVIDISTPSAPTLISTLIDSTNLNSPKSIKVVDSYAYIVSDLSNNLAIIDVSDPATMTLTGTYSNILYLSVPNSVFISGYYAYITSELIDSITVIDISTPSVPTLAGFLADSTNLDIPTSIYLYGNHAYIAAQNSNMLTVIDINGVKLSSTSIGDVKSNYISVSNNLLIAGETSIKTDLNVLNIKAKGLFISKDQATVATYGSITLNGYSGILIFTNGALTANTSTQFTVSNNVVSPNSVILINVLNWPNTNNGKPVAKIAYILSGSFSVIITNVSGVSMSVDPVSVGFVVI